VSGDIAIVVEQTKITKTFSNVSLVSQIDY